MKAATAPIAMPAITTVFQSTPPVKAATGVPGFMTVAALFQSTPPVKAATAPELSRPRRRKISIHAAREGGDGRPSMVIYDLVISIHAAREGGDEELLQSLKSFIDFNPRRP